MKQNKPFIMNNIQIITSDIETILLNNNKGNYHTPIIISLTTKYQSKAFLIKDVNNIKEKSKKMFSEYFRLLVNYRRKYKYNLLS